jgi:hypothetical protein
VKKGSFSTVQSLLQRGVDVNARDELGNSALNRALIHGYLDMAKLLIDKGADLDSRNKDGNTALMLLVGRSYFSDRGAMRLLLDRGADMDIKNNDGNSALMIAVIKSRPQTLEMLKETYRARKKLAEEFARVAEVKRRAEIFARRQSLTELGKNRPKPGPRRKPPEAA